jgi:UDP-2-acetamido-2-deoxy-ribo-hexuluronate aminotransferase
VRVKNSTHVFHQYTLQIKNGKRDSLKKHLEDVGIPAMIYYPVPLNEQEAFKSIGSVVGTLNVTEDLCRSVLSLPMHTELSDDQQVYIATNIQSFFK